MRRRARRLRFARSDGLKFGRKGYDVGCRAQQRGVRGEADGRAGKGEHDEPSSLDASS